MDITTSHLHDRSLFARAINILHFMCFDNSLPFRGPVEEPSKMTSNANLP